MTSRLPTGASDLTRRQALQAGGAGATAAFLLLHLPASAAGARAGRPSHLLRSTWRDLQAPHLRAGPSLLKLEGVGDLSNASNVRSLRDSEDAFSLVLSGPAGLGQSGAPVRVTNSELGTFDLFVSPLGEGRYEAVVNRVLSNRESRRTPPRSKRSAQTPGPAAPARTDEHGGKGTEPEPKPAIRKVRASRMRGGAKVVVDLDRTAQVDEVVVWLKRDGKVLATATKRVRGKGRATLSLKRKRRLRKGLYEIDVMALERDGEQTHRRVRKRLR